MRRIPKNHSLFKSPEKETLTCRACGPVQPERRWKPMQNGRRHVGAYCPRCARWLKWVRQSQPDRLAFLKKNLDQLQNIERSIFEIRHR